MTQGVSTNRTSDSSPILIEKGPLGFGDPDDKRLRKVEKDIIIPKRLKEEATKRCGRTVRNFLECADKEGLLMVFRCRDEHTLQEKCISKWMNNEKFVNEITEKYLEERSYYRSTGKPLYPIANFRSKKELPPAFDEEFYEK